MAEECENFEKENEDLKEKKPPKHDSGAADLEKITDHVEEAEISAQDIADVCKFMYFLYYRSEHSSAVA